MVVAPDHRRRGVGTAILEGVLAFLEGRGVIAPGAVCDPDGRPLYAGQGFASIGAAPRLSSRAAPCPVTATSSSGSRDSESWTSVAAFDAPRFGGDRALAAADVMLADAARAVITAVRDGSIVG